MITSPATKAFLIHLLDELERAKCSPILLRNFEKFPEEIGNDLDVYVCPQHLSPAFSILDSCARTQGGFIGHIHRRGYFVAIWLRFPDCEPPVHIDLYHGALTWHGLHFLTDRSLVMASQRTEPRARFRIPAPHHEALISLLASVLWGGYFKKQYLDRFAILLKDQRQRDSFTELMKHNFGPEGCLLASAVIDGKTPTVVNETFCRRLRQSLVCQSLKERPIASFIGWLRHWMEEFACYGWRLPGMEIEYNGAAWGRNQVMELREMIGPYFGGVHVIDRKDKSLTGRLSTRRLRGTNQLVIVRGTNFSINRNFCADLPLDPFTNVSLLAETALRLLAKNVDKSI
jgi:hypothetical protein